jgi:hypothetical protein
VVADEVNTMLSAAHEQIYWFGELLDDVLLQLNIVDSTPSDPKRRQLAELLIHVVTRPIADLKALQIAALLRAQETDSLEGWSQIGRALLTPNVPDEMRHELEQLAFRLDVLRSEAVAKMQGAMRG